MSLDWVELGSQIKGFRYWHVISNLQTLSKHGALTRFRNSSVGLGDISPSLWIPEASHGSDDGQVCKHEVHLVWEASWAPLESIWSAVISKYLHVTDPSAGRKKLTCEQWLHARAKHGLGHNSYTVQHSPQWKNNKEIKGLKTRNCWKYLLINKQGFFFYSNESFWHTDVQIYTLRLHPSL